MKKEYSKPNMEIVSFSTESLATDVSGLTKSTDVQGTGNMKTITYY